MTSVPACSCGRPAPDATICRACTRELLQALVTAIEITPDLDDATARLMRRPSGGRPSGHPEPPLPIDLAASDAARTLRVALAVYAYAIRRPTDIAPQSDIRGLARWLCMRTGQLTQHDRAADAHREITRAVRAALVVIDRPPERAPAGTCEQCGAQLLAELGADEVTCRCGTVTLALQERRRERAAAADVLGTAAEISGALARIGITVPRGTITSWASRGRLTPRPGGAYALSDVLALHAQNGNHRGR